MKVRGSRADLAIECAGSLVPTDAPYNPQSDEAIEGRAKHEALAYVTRGEEPPIDAIAERYQVDADEIQKAVHYGRQAWSELARWMPYPETEVSLEGEVTTGTCDVISAASSDAESYMAQGSDGLYSVVGIPPPKNIVILDWKTGWSGDEHQHQLMAYADAARSICGGMPESGCITGFEVWIRSREYRTRNFTEAALDGFRERMADQIRSAESDHPQYAAGVHCKFCPRQNQCRVRDDYLRSTIAALVPFGGEPHAITREDLGRLYEPSKIVRRALDAFDRMLDEALAEGDVPLGDGRTLGLKSVEQDKLDGALVAELLITEFGFSTPDLSEVLSATKSGIERVVKGRVAKGCGAAEMRRILGRLREAGAVHKVTQQRKEITEP